MKKPKAMWLVQVNGGNFLIECFHTKKAAKERIKHRSIFESLRINGAPKYKVLKFQEVVK